MRTGRLGLIAGWSLVASDAMAQPGVPTPHEPMTTEARAGALPHPQPQPPPQPPPQGMSHGTRGFVGGLAGVGAGGVLGVVAAYVTLAVAHEINNCREICGTELLPAAIAGQLGMGIGLAFGVTVVGNHRGGRGSFGASLGGALVGSAVSWVFATSDTTIDNGMWGVAFFTLPVAGAIIGYWTTHDHDATLPVVPVPAPVGGAPGVVLSGRF